MSNKSHKKNLGRLSDVFESIAQFPYRLSVILFALLVTAGHFGLSEILNLSLAKPIEFKLREKAGLDPDIDPRLKLIIFDDVSVTQIRKPDLEFSDWEKLLTHLSKHQPARIIIDKVFQIVEKSESLDSYLNASRSFAPVSVGVFSSVNSVIGRDEIKTNIKVPRSQYKLPWKSAAEAHILGPSVLVRDSFQGFGNINYSGHGQLPLAIQSEEGGVFPSLGLTTGASFELSEDGLIVDGSLIPSRSNGNIQVNLSEITKYYKNSKSLSTVLRAAERNQRIKGYNVGDVIFILPLMYTGNADFKSTPIGEIPGGLLHVSVANSLLTGEWIKSFDFPLITIIVGGFTALIFAHSFSPLIGLAIILLSSLSVIGAGISGFIYANYLFPWAEGSMVMLTVGLAAIAEKAKVLEMRSLQVKHTLAGLVSPKILEGLLKSPGRIRKQAQASRVTVMFIDIEGFSLKSQERDPDLVFRRLKDELSHLCDRVHLYGGIVDKTLGDGLMCYFGHTFIPNQTLTDREHAIAAIGCAIDIQIDSAKRAIKNARDPEISDSEKMAFPLRIGINTGDVFAGNVGTEERIDLTVIGTTVNWAKRFEDSCESFRIMVGPKTKEVLSGSNENSDATVIIGDSSYFLSHRELIVKHYEHKWSGWECNPFEKDFNFLLTALEAVSRSTTVEPSRYQMSDSVRIIVDNKFEALPIEFTSDGISIVCSKYLSKRDTVELGFTVDRSALQDWQVELMNTKIRASVMWGVQKAGESQHGLKYVDLTAAEKNKILSLLRKLEKGLPNLEPEVGPRFGKKIS